MNEASTRAAQSLVLPLDTYKASTHAAFENAEKQLEPPPAPPGAPMPTPVFALGAAPEIEVIGGSGRWPAALALRHSLARPWEVSYEPNLLFVVSDLRSGSVRVAGSAKPDKRMATPPPSRSGPPPSEFDRAATMHGIERLHVPPLFGPSWPSTGYAATALNFDWRSNTVVARRKPAPEYLPDMFRAPSTFLAPAPPAEAGSGVSISAPASAISGEPVPVVVRISTVADQVAVVRAAHPGTDPTNASVLVASLLVVRLDNSAPPVVTVVLPVRLSSGRAEAEAGFDAAAAAGQRLLPGDYRLYLVSGASVAGPAALTVTP